ncbi:adenine phosphoribosyltransferase [Physocladia obscura]|uniref:adenine phosphoribosyltransferase n=1 Tax=Physocladia obscura TaxID=109957 RepID=A0AAD5T429_9FUNG|nr:adenine phosphoribosyltransferase [Physocladia obscura]
MSLPETAFGKVIFGIGILAIYNGVQTLVPSMRLTNKIYVRKPKEATAFAARNMGLWTFTSGLIRLYAAYNLENAAVYQLCMWTFALALFAFVGEVFVHKTAPISSTDIFGIFQDPLAVETLLTHILHHITSANLGKIDVIVGLDARGFLLGPTIALRLGCAFVPVRKAGKLPGATTQVAYTKEYGTDYFEIQEGAIKPGQNVIILDDLIATGGSAKGAGDLVKLSGGKTVEYIFFIELSFFKGRNVLDAPTYAVMEFDD